MVSEREAPARKRNGDTMKFKEIQVGEDYEVGSENYSHLARVLEVGEFTKTVYGSREFRGHKVTVKGARVARIVDGEPQLTRVQRDRKYGEPESTYIDPFDGTTVTVPATEDSWTEKEVDATEWVASREVLRPVSEWRNVQAALRERKAREARLEEQTANLHPCVAEVLAHAGVSEYRASKWATGGKVELTYAEFMKVVDHLDPEGDRR